MASLSLREVCKSYPGKVDALRGVNLSVAADECVAFVGPSGSGKTTLLRIVAGLEACDAGVVSFDDRDMSRVEPRHRNVAMVFQEDALYPHLSVFENIAFPLRARKIPATEISARVQEAATKFGVAHLMNRRPQALSGGERQRVALGRALVRRPSVLLLDEPFSHLDAHLRRDLRETLQRTRADAPVTTVFVTHDQREAVAIGDRIAVMHEGRISQIGTSRELLECPVDCITARFIGDPPVNLLAGRVQAGRFESSGIAFDLRPDQAASLQPGPVLLGVRPYAIHPGTPGDGGDVAVFFASPRSSVFLGSIWESRLVLDGGKELVAVTPRSIDAVEFHFDKREVFFFADSRDGGNLWRVES